MERHSIELQKAFIARVRIGGHEVKARALRRFRRRFWLSVGLRQIGHADPCRDILPAV